MAGAGRTSSRFRPRFFVRVEEQEVVPTVYEGTDVVLGREDGHHARDVLRLRSGDLCEVVLEPLSAVFAAKVHAVDARVVLRLGLMLEARPPDYTQVWLVQSLIELAKLDLVVEKGTEVGLDGFVVVPASTSPRMGAGRLVARLDRLRRIVLESAKQSKRLAVPPVEATAAIEEAFVVAGGGTAFHVALEPTAGARLRRVLAAGVRRADSPVGGAGAERVVLWVGPEGGWSAGELDLLVALGVVPVRLGGTVLRAETAGPVAGALVRFALGDW